MSARLAGVALGVLVGLWHGAATSGQDQPRGPGPKCGVRVRSTPAVSQGAHAVFSAREIVDLNFEILLKPEDGAEEQVEIRVFTPEGHLYQTIDVPVSAPGSRETERVVAGYPFPLGVSEARAEEGSVTEDPESLVPSQEPAAGERPRPLKGDDREKAPPPRPRRLVVTAPPFPVAGTHITTHSLYGWWRVEARPSRALRACQAAFQIEP